MNWSTLRAATVNSWRCFLEILRSVNHAHQLDAVFESDIENDSLAHRTSTCFCTQSTFNSLRLSHFLAD
jgi:hypothetical protein